MPLKAPKPDVSSKKKTYNLLCRDIQKAKKELQGIPVSKASAIILKEWKKVKASKKNFTKERKNHMKRHCKDAKKIMWMKWRSLNFSKSVTRRIGRFYSLKHYLNQMNLKNYQNPLMIQVRKNRSLKKHQAMEKRPLQRQAKSEKDPTI